MSELTTEVNMKIKYLGPRAEVNVGGYGNHQKDTVKDYPKHIAEDLLASKRQNFVTEANAKAKLDALTVEQLKERLKKASIEIPADAKKADLIALVEKHETNTQGE